MQTTPIAVTALNSELLERAHVADLTDIGTLSPNLQIRQNTYSADVAAIYLRGFGTTNNDFAVDPHIAVFVDGIYQPSVNSAQLDMFDVGQIEVQGGPQGTLLGKNAPIGAIYITSAKPTGDFSGEVEGDYGSYDHFGGRIKVNFPIIRDVLAAKVSFVEKEGGNWVRDTVTGGTFGGENVKAGKLSLMFTPDPAFEWDLNASLLMQRNPQQGQRSVAFIGGVPGTPSSATQPAPFICVLGLYSCGLTEYGTTQMAGDTDRNRGDQVQVASTMSYHLTPVTLTSVTGYISFWGVNNADVDVTPLAILNAYGDRARYDEETQEIRISSNKDGGWDLDGHADWVIGGYYSNDNYNMFQNLGAFDFGPPGDVNNASGEWGTTVSEAVFGHLIYHFTDQWSGTFGVRESWDHKDHSYQLARGGQQYYDIPAGFHDTTYEVGTAYQFDDNHMAYVRFAQGYEAGGLQGIPGCAGCGSIYQPEYNNAYEVGFKTDWLDKRLRVNASFFLNELSNLQLATTIPSPNPPYYVQVTQNAGAATVEGFETQIIAVPTDDITTHLNVGYLHPKYDKFEGTSCSNTNAPADCSGIPFGFAPKWTINLGGDYVMDLPNDWGSADFSLDWDYNSPQYAEDPPYPASFQQGYGLVNAGLKYTDPSDKYSIEFFGKNILDRKYKAQFTASGGLVEAVSDGRPAEWGMRLIAKFGPY